MSDSVRDALVKSVKANYKSFEKLLFYSKAMNNRIEAEDMLFFLQHYSTDISVYHLYNRELIQEEG